MKDIDLNELISCLEYGTKLHISVVFLDDYGNYKTALPRERTIHSKPFCDYKKSTPIGFEKCFKCRNTALGRAVKYKQPFGGLCVNSVYEYCYPVLDDSVVVAVIFIGNIIEKNSDSGEITEFYETFEIAFSKKNCRIIAEIIEKHIKLLISEYSNIKPKENPLINNIKSYISEGLYYDITVSDIASVFSYNEKYIGKLFKGQSGLTVKEYINQQRLLRADELLRRTDFTVTEISQRCGFNNVTYFNRLFKARYGVTPTEYRKSCT